MFRQYVRHSLIRHYADFHGRASRMEYLCLVSLCFMIRALIRMLMQILGGMFGTISLSVFSFGTALNILIDLVLLVPICAVHARRMHDTGRSAALPAVLIGLILAVNAIPFSMIFKELSQESVSIFLLLEYVRNMFLPFLMGPYGPVQLLQSLVMIPLLVPGNENDFLFQILPGMASILLLGLLAWLMLRRGTEGDNRYGPAPETFHDSGRGMVSAVSNCLIHGYARFAGRATRSEYWWFTFVSMLLVNVFSVSWLNVFFVNSHFYDVSTVRAALFIFLALLPQLALFLPGLAVLVRRLHDREKSGLWLVGMLCMMLVAGFIGIWILFESYGSMGGTVICLLCLLVPCCLLMWQLILPGTRGPNRYGPNPRAGHTL